ncbi:acetyl-CoA acetyltransferase [Methylobacterium platani]|uniref:Acetyl-CoA acetyltransferase n=2 Tax=Methylobacterium platani TaxID=427683 RepID=A0A179SEL0_9HYPH|nr:acetyl-CoA acetyltransferase [Methylobacterium platani]KMO12971.1 acetyl-CoA acetyltransferase [Methylobacterium platani JCM 14648]OAS25866.1 acetyl-CoA acetyltransferase [Methylobacterium platani]
MTDPARIPVIVGIGEVADRPDTPGRGPIGPEPAALMAEALARADADAGGGWLPRLGSLDVVNAVSWPYADLPARVADLIGHRPARLAYGPVGGETPVRFLHEAARRIARGEVGVAALCSGEAEYGAGAARRAGLSPERDAIPPWTAPDPAWTNPRVRDYLHPQALRHGLSQPVFVYPLYETALQAAWGQTPRQGRDESAALWSAMSRVAAQNPHGWLRRSFTAEEIATPSPGNRPIAWPYLKLMVANPVVNQGAALIVTSLALARAAGLPDRRTVPIGPGAAAAEPRDWLARDRFDHAPAQDAVLGGTLRRAGLAPADLAAIELYSCFPCVPKMARRRLGLPGDAVPTVAGGLTFFGAPLNGYMAHAACAMVRTLRAAPGAAGLLYGQGEFVTKHHALVLGGPARVPADEAMSVQDEADHRRGPVPPVVADASGRAALETHTVLFDREGAPQKGVVVLRRGLARLLARVPAADRATLGLLTDLDRSPVGLDGTLRMAADGLLEWEAA